MATDPTTEFFDGLAERGHVPLLEKATGTIGIELVDGRKRQRWRIVIAKGDVAVSRTNGEADCSFRLDKALFERIASGEVNPVAAMLRGAVSVEGDWRLAVLFTRLLPGGIAQPAATDDPPRRR